MKPMILPILLFMCFSVSAADLGADAYNAGTTAYQEGKKTEAVAHYFRALEQAPRNGDLRNNWESIAAEFGYPLEHSKLKMARDVFLPLRWMTFRQNSLTTAIVWTIFCLAGTIFLVKKTPFLKKSLLVIGVLLFYFTTGLLAHHLVMERWTRAVILPNELPLRPSFAEPDRAIGRAEAGREVLVIDGHDLPDGTRWLLIDLNGVQGWVPAKDVSLI